MRVVCIYVCKGIKYQIPTLTELGQALLSELSLYSKLGGVSVPELDRDSQLAYVVLDGCLSMIMVYVTNI